MNPSIRDAKRRLALVPYLQSKQGISVAEVARDFGVHPRVIRKDVTQLIMTGVSPYGGDLIDVNFDAFEGEDRIYLSNAEFMSRPLRINAGEAAALIVALRALRDAADPGQADLIDSALAKVEAVVEDGATPGVDVLVAPTDPAVVTPIHAALTAQRRLEIDYLTPARDAVATRQVDPHATFTREGHVYLDAWCHRAQAPRFFRFDRIQRAEVLDATVSGAPSTRSEVEFFGTDSAGFDVELEVAPAGRWVVEHYGAEILDQSDATWRVRLTAGDSAEIRRLALRSGGAVRVVSPESIRHEVTDRARAGLAAYDGSTRAIEES